jgi:hypothetical protein
LVLGQQDRYRLQVGRLVTGVVGRVAKLAEEFPALALEQFLVENLSLRRRCRPLGLLDGRLLVPEQLATELSRLP